MESYAIKASVWPVRKNRPVVTMTPPLIIRHCVLDAANRYDLDLCTARAVFGYGLSVYKAGRSVAMTVSLAERHAYALSNK